MEIFLVSRRTKVDPLKSLNLYVTICNRRDRITHLGTQKNQKGGKNE